MKSEVTFTYKNHKGETSIRLVRPEMIHFGSNEYHPEPQWLMLAWDLHKEALRSFAIKDIRDWGPI